MQWELILIFGFTSAAALYDQLTARIPNALSYGGIVLGCSMGLVSGIGPGIIDSLVGLGIGFLITLPLFLMSSIGGGDVKLFGAIGALLGFPLVIDVLLITFMVGAIISVIVIIVSGRLLMTIKEVIWWLSTSTTPDTEKIQPALGLQVPMGVSLMLATIITVYFPQFRFSSNLTNSVAWI
ncbi:MAG: prepilin peptidase CpaA [Planctomycetota bacterium]|jgi:prepilin peptidase CpaA